MADTKCNHCDGRIVQVNSWRGSNWVHQPAGAAFADGEHRYCYITVAEPKKGAPMATFDAEALIVQMALSLFDTQNIAHALPIAVKAVTDHLRAKVVRSMTPAQIKALLDEIDQAAGVQR